MKIPCPECKKACRRKVVTRGQHNLNRIYYKCEPCNLKVGWEDELQAGAPLKTKATAEPTAAPPAPAAPKPAAAAANPTTAALAAAKPRAAAAAAAPAPAAPARAAAAEPAPPVAAAPAAPKPAAPARVPPLEVRVGHDAGDDEVELLFERPAPARPQNRAAGAAPAAGRAAAPQALSPDSHEEGEKASPPAPQAAAPKARPPSQTEPPPHPASHARGPPPRTAGEAAGAKQAAGSQPAEGQGCTATSAHRPHATGRPVNVYPGSGVGGAAGGTSTATKRKLEEDGAEAPPRAAKRPARGSPQLAAAAAAPGTRAGAAPGSGPGNGIAYPHKSNAPVSSAQPATAADMNKASAAAMAAAVAAARSAKAQAQAQGIPPPAVRPSGHSVQFTPITVAAPAAMAGRGVGEGGASNSPGRVGKPGADVEEALRLEVRRLRTEVAMLSQSFKQEKERSGKLEELHAQVSREANDLRRLYQDALQRERAAAIAANERERLLTERLNQFITRERLQQAQQAAQQAAHQAAQQAAAQQAKQQAQQAAEQQQQQQAQQQQQPFGYNFFWGPSMGPVPRCFFTGAQADFVNAAYGAAAEAAHAQANGAAPQGAGKAQKPAKPAAAAGGAAGAGAAGAGASAAPPPAARPPAGDDPAVLAFAQSLPPALDDGMTIKALKQFLVEAGAEALCRTCSEKADLLALARERLNGWEIRRAVVCSRLVNQAAGDRALFRLDGAKAQAAALSKTYRELMLRLHPDKNPKDQLATPAFQYLQAAYKRLSAAAGA